jgi:hypothetical protein
MTVDALLDRLTTGGLLTDCEWVANEPRRSPRRAVSNSGIASSTVPTLVPFGTSTIAVYEQLPWWSRAAMERISRLGELKANWDSYGGRPIDPYCAMAAIQFVLSVLGPSIPTPAIVPLNRGGIQLEWHRRGVDLEVAVLSPVRYRVLFEDEESGEEIEQLIATDFQPLTALLARISHET